LACLTAGHDADAVLIPEPFGPTILTAQVGVIWFTVSVRGIARHVLEADLGINAIEACCTLFQILRRLEAELNHDLPPEFQHLKHPFHLNVGKVKGGCWPSSVPALAEFDCRLGFPPGITFEDIRDRVVSVIQQAADSDPCMKESRPQVKFYGFRSEGHTVAPNLAAFQVLGDCHQTLSGKRPESKVSTSTTDLRPFVHFGRGQATCYGPTAENIHAENERVNIESILHTAKVYALFLARWCGLAT
jgi:acetylornithine deacetylase